MKRALILLLSFAILQSSPRLAIACGQPISHEDLCKQAQLIVIGELSNRKELDATWATATLTIDETLKGNATRKTVTVRFLAKPGNTATWTYQGTEKGIWFLSNVQTEPELYATFHSNGLVVTTFTDPQAKAEVAAFIADVRKILTAEKK